MASESSFLLRFFRVKELRRKLYFTLGALLIFRIGTYIPIPGIDPRALKAYFDAQNSQAFSLAQYFDIFSGGAFANFSVLMLGIAPYISMSIVVQILVFSFPALKRLQQEEGGRRKIARYTRYGTAVLALIQSYVVSMYAQMIPHAIALPFRTYVIFAMISVTTGTMFLLWLGDQISQRGLGNGASMLIFVGIISRLPFAFARFFRVLQDPTRAINPVFAFLVLLIFVLVIVLLIYENLAQRKVPVRYARRLAGGVEQKTYIPLKLNSAGVIPVIFASALLGLPLQFLSNMATSSEFVRRFLVFLDPNGAFYSLFMVVLIIFFSYAYTKIQFNTVEIAKRIRDNGGSLADVPPSEIETYLDRIVNRLLLPGSVFLAFIAVLPYLLQLFFSFPSEVAAVMGGTSLLIMVGVNLNLLSQMEALTKMSGTPGGLGRSDFLRRI